MAEEMKKRVRIIGLDDECGFEVMYEEKCGTAWFLSSRAKFWIDSENGGQIKMLGVDSGGYDCAELSLNENQARAVGELLMVLAGDLHRKKLKEEVGQ
jgi:hypothetical protein